MELSPTASHLSVQQSEYAISLGGVWPLFQISFLVEAQVRAKLMAKILIVHGISNQYGGATQLYNAWYPALCDGLDRAGCPTKPDANDCYCPFYGHLFRSAGALSGPSPVNLQNMSDEELQLVEQIWERAARTDNAVPAPNEPRDTLIYAPRMAERALAALAKSKYLADYVPLQFLGDLRQVALYLNDPVIRAKILGCVQPHITSETRVVVGHSLGSVIAYEAVASKPEQVSELVTLGSPLGIRNVVFDKLTPKPDTATGRGHWPGHIRHWTNIAAKGDIVAAEKQLAPLFGSNVKDFVIDSGWDAHSSTRYLDVFEAGKAIARGLV